MAEKSDHSLQESIEKLEAAVAELQRLLKQTPEASKHKELKEPGPPTNTFAHEQAEAPVNYQKILFPTKSKPIWKSFKLPENMSTSEYWLNKIGIGLLLFGVAFLFKYSIDQGWLTPASRIAFGMILGIGLVVAGLRISIKRRHFGQVLMGGGIAAFYITGFAVFQIFTLVSHPVAFTFMASVTLLAFILSLKKNGAVLALIGAIGGFGTPFLLYTDSGSIPGLVGYTCLILGGTSAIYFYRGWRSLLWISVFGGWLVLLIGTTKGLPTDREEAISDRWALQAGILFCWLLFWVLPPIREFVLTKNPTRWLRPSLNLSKNPNSQETRFFLHHHLYLLSVFTPLIALWMSMLIWSLSSQTWGWITLGGALVYGFASWRLSGLNFMGHLSYTHSLISAMLLTYAFYLLLDGNSLLFVLAAEAAVLHIVARRLSDKIINIAAHIFFGVIGLWLVQRLFYGDAEGIAVFNMQALTDLWAIGVTSGIAILATSFEEKEKNIYLLLIHIAVLGWFLRELASLPNGQGYVTIAWGVYSVILLVIGLRINFDKLRTAAMVTLLLVVGKLFFVDLANLETIWRTLFGDQLLFSSAVEIER
jgi:uncharacterized membrane protein